MHDHEDKKYLDFAYWTFLVFIFILNNDVEMQFKRGVLLVHLCAYENGSFSTDNGKSYCNITFAMSSKLGIHIARPCGSQ